MSHEKVRALQRQIKIIEVELKEHSLPYLERIGRLFTEIQEICQHPDLKYEPPWSTGGCGEYESHGGWSSCPDCRGYWNHIRGDHPHNWHDKDSPYYKRILKKRFF